MGTPEVAAAFVVAGIVAALLGLGFSLLTSRRRQATEAGPAGHADAGLFVIVAGLVAAILGAGDWVFLVLVS